MIPRNFNKTSHVTIDRFEIITVISVVYFYCKMFLIVYVAMPACVFKAVLGKVVTRVYASFLVGYPQLPEPISLSSHAARLYSHYVLTDVKPSKQIITVYVNFACVRTVYVELFPLFFCRSWLYICKFSPPIVLTLDDKHLFIFIYSTKLTEGPMVSKIVSWLQRISSFWVLYYKMGLIQLKKLQTFNSF